MMSVDIINHTRDDRWST